MALGALAGRRCVPPSALPSYPPTEAACGPDEAPLAPSEAECALVRLAERIRSMWVMAYREWRMRAQGRPSQYCSSPRWDGGALEGRNYKPIWPKVAKVVVEHGLNPQVFVYAQFYERPGGDDSPVPTLLLSEAGLRSYAIYHEQLLPDLQLAFDCQTRAIQMATFTKRGLYADDKQTYVSILLDPDTQLSALYRYCFARQAGLLGVAECWRKHAVEQYLHSPAAYSRVWGKHIPESIHREAKALAAAMKLIDPAEMTHVETET